MPDDPNARPAWWLDKKQMRLWDAHLQVIEKIEKRVAEVERLFQVGVTFL